MFRTIQSQFWRDPKVRALSVDAKLLFLYLVTNDHSHISGIYYIPVTLIQHETTLSSKALREAFDSLTEASLVAYDTQTEVVWVINMLRHQTSYCGMNGKIIRSVTNQLKTLHDSELIDCFVMFYSDLDIAYDKPHDSLTPAYQKPQDSLKLHYKGIEQGIEQGIEKEDSASPVGDTPTASRSRSTKQKATAESEVERWGTAFDAALPSMRSEFSGIDWGKTKKLWLNWVEQNWSKTAKRKDPAKSFHGWLLAGKWLVRSEKSRTTDDDVDWVAYAAEVNAKLEA